MTTNAVIDRCGFDSALRGVIPGEVGTLYDSYILPHSEYRAYLTAMFRLRFAPGARPPALQDLLKGVAVSSQPYGLTLGAAMHISLPEALYSIPVVLSQVSASEVLDGVRIHAGYLQLPADSAEFIETAIRARADVIACGHEQNTLALAVLREYRVQIAMLNHECRLRETKDFSDDISAG